MGAVYTFGALAGMVVTASPWFSERVQLTIAGVLVTAGVLPFLLFSRKRGPIVPASTPMIQAGGRRKRNLIRIWIARLLVQISGSIFFAYLLFYFETVDSDGPVLRPGRYHQPGRLAGGVGDPGAGAAGRSRRGGSPTRCGRESPFW
jgi:hypothetical protein